MKTLFKLLVAASLLLGIAATAQDQHRDDDHDHGYGDHHDHWAARMSPEDQSHFDSYYSRWLDYRERNDRDQIVSMEKRMRDLMAKYSIPPDADFSQIASQTAHRRHIPPFSGDDARRFSSYYSRWQNYRQNNDQDQVVSMERRMRDVMNRHDIPGDVSYDEMMDVLNGHHRH